MSDERQTPHRGVYGGSRVGFLEHEIDAWIWTRVRANSDETAGLPLPTPEHPRIIPMREVEKRTGFTRIHIWRLEKAGRFPRRVRLGDRSEAANAAA
jgi:predicted DNA-binding transcriptional regulator AlpA